MCTLPVMQDKTIPYAKLRPFTMPEQQLYHKIAVIIPIMNHICEIL